VALFLISELPQARALDPDDPDALPIANPDAPDSETEPSDNLTYDEYGNVIVKERKFTEKELAAMQAVYP